MKRYDVEPLADMHPELGLLMAAMNDGTREWRENLGRVGVDTVCWQPYPGGYSIGGLILHMCECEAWWVEEFALGRKLGKADLELWRSKDIQQMRGQWPTPPRKPIRWYYDRHDEVRDRVIRAVREHNDPAKEHAMGREHRFTFRWILAHLVEHDSYHGGQAVMLAQLKKRLPLP